MDDWKSYVALGAGICTILTFLYKVAKHASKPQGVSGLSVTINRLFVLSLSIGLLMAALIALTWANSKYGLWKSLRGLGGTSGPVVQGTMLVGEGTVKYGEVPMEPGGIRAGYFPEEGFSFASGQAVSPDAADFYIEAPGEAPPGGMHAGGVDRLVFEMRREGSKICPMGPVDFDGLAEAPDPKKGNDYRRSGSPVKQGEVYCFSLDDGKFWGKLKVLSCDGTRSRGKVKFLYVLQRDGTRKFSPAQRPE